MKLKSNNKLILKILSGLVALVLWFAITYTEDPIISQNLGDISIEFEGEKRLTDNGLIIINKEKIPNLSAVIRGKRSSVISAIGTVTASCDVSEIETAGENLVEVKYIYPTSTITMAKIKTKEITVETQKLVTRNIPVRITLKNPDKNEEFIVNPKSVAEKIRIKGAETDVYSVSYAAVEVDVTDMSSNNTQEYFYKLCDKDGNVVPQDNIIYKSSDTVSIENFVYKKVELPVKVELSQELSQTHYLTVKNISAEKLNVGLIEDVNVTELTAVIKTISENGEYKLELTAPEGIYLPEESRKITATCEVVPLVKKETEIKVEIQNNQDKKLTASPENVKVLLNVPEGMDVSGKVKAFVDVKDAEDGDTLPVIIEMPDYVECIGEYTVKVYIK